MRAFLMVLSLAAVLFLAINNGPSLATDNKYDALKRFSQVLDLVERYYVEPVTRPELIEGAVRGMLQELDPHSSYLDIKEFKEMQESTSGEFSGIGVEITLQNNRLTVVSPIEDTPAYEAGMKSGDIILEIDGESTQDFSLTDAVQRIRGPRGEPVTLTVLHPDDNTPIRLTIVRDSIPIVSVKNRSLDDGYLYLRLTKFNERTTRELHEAVDAYREDHPLKGVVLDLRNNPGGLLDQAVSVADTFLDDGMVVYIKGKAEESRTDYVAGPQSSDIEVPMVVLINAGSASASEIVAGALQDHKRALLVGERTFGKGSVQTIIPLSDQSGLKLTTALYYTPSGRSIQAEGVEPDLVIPFEPVREDRERIETVRSMIVREKDLKRHLSNGNGGKEEDGKSVEAENAEDMLARDNQLRMALQLVKKLPAIRAIQ